MSQHLSDSYFTAACGDLGKCREIVGSEWIELSLPESSNEIEISLTLLESTPFSNPRTDPSGHLGPSLNQPRGNETIKQMLIDLSNEEMEFKWNDYHIEENKSNEHGNRGNISSVLGKGDIPPIPELIAIAKQPSVKTNSNITKRPFVEEVEEEEVEPDDDDDDEEMGEFDEIRAQEELDFMRDNQVYEVDQPSEEDVVYTDEDIE